MPSAKITFTGLLVFRRDPTTSNYEVGVLRARNEPHPHIFEIQVTPNPNDPTSDSLRLDDELEEPIQNGDILWRLDVEPEGSVPAGIVAHIDPPRDRTDSTPANARDFGWIIDLEKEFHGELKRKPGGLQPIILFTTGKLSTSCKTDFIDVLQNGRPRDFGFIAGALTLTIDTSQGQQPVLNVLKNGNKVPLFRLQNTAETDYSIAIRNVPPAGSDPAQTGGHFHMFYDLVFDNVPPEERVTIEEHQPPTRPFDRCPEVKQPDPDPFRCGGVQVGGGPLGHP
jgi:hypothetical protein